MTNRKCPVCKTSIMVTKENKNKAAICANCDTIIEPTKGIKFIGSTTGSVVVTDINIPFFSVLALTFKVTVSIAIITAATCAALKTLGLTAIF